MDSLSDDDIELLKHSPGDDVHENSASMFDHLDSNIKPFDLLKRINSVDDSFSPASIHALQTAFSSLQKKHNQQVKKNIELKQKNKLINKALMDVRQTGGQGQFHNMDEMYLQEASVVHAAGGTSEDDSALAESRAKQGYVQHLQRELLISNNTILKGNEEIQRLKNEKDNIERDLSRHLKERDRLHSDLEVMVESLGQSKEHLARKDSEVAHLTDKLQSEKDINRNLGLEIQTLQERLEDNQRNGTTGQNEIQNLRSKLATVDNELKKSYIQYRELNRMYKEKEKAVLALEAECKQFKIEVDINRTHRREKQMDDTDDVDGDIETLQRALIILGSQREEVTELKQKIAEQQQIITQIHRYGKQHYSKSLDSCYRTEAQGASFGQHYEELPVYGNFSNSGFQQIIPSNPSPICRRRSDRGDYRGMDRTPRTSPRVNDTILPTGNQNVTPMLAMETNQLPKRMELAGIVDTGNTYNAGRTMSPGENTCDSRYVNTVMSSSSDIANPRSPSLMNQSPYAQQSPPRTTNSARTGTVHEPYGSAFVEMSNTSPRNRETVNMVNNPNISNNPIFFQSNMPDSAVIQTGARPRVPPSGANYLNLQYDDTHMPTSPRQQHLTIPNRMTQSEIIVRDKPVENNAMTRSVLDPLQPLDIPSSNNTRQSDYILAETPGIGQSVPRRDIIADHTYENQYREQYTGPDYENIYDANAQTESKCPIEEHEDIVFVTANELRDINSITRAVQEETGNGNVSALKICPVCNEECSRLTLDQFQMHVFECFDNVDDSPATLQPVSGGGNDDDRNCPMCRDVFPLTISQEVYEQHVLSHFGEDPAAEQFEILHP